MILRTEDKQLFLVIIPISTETTEHRRSVIHRVSQHAEFHVRIRNNTAVNEHKIWQRHGSPRLFALTKKNPSRRSVYHTDRFGRGLGLDLQREETDESNERRGEVERHAVAYALEERRREQRSNNSR